MSYAFPTGGGYRAKCVRVVDGDTFDLFVDCGFYQYHLGRFRLLGVDTPELNSANPAERARAQAAKAMTTELLTPAPAAVDGPWPLRIVTVKTDSFGRFLADVFWTVNGVEMSLAAKLLEVGLAVPYTR